MENTNNTNGMGPAGNAMWGNMNWGNTPPYWNQRYGAGGVATTGLILGAIGTFLGLASGGLGLFGMNRNNGFGPNGGQGGQNIYDRLAAVEANVAVNTQRDIDLAEQTKLQIENAKLQSALDIKESEQKTTALVTMVNNQVIVNGQRLTCLENDLNKILQIGIPQANIIPTPTAAATSAGA